MTVSSDRNKTERLRSAPIGVPIMGKHSTTQPGVPSLSVVCAVFDEAEAITELLDQLARVLGDLDLTFEIIIVDDGSRDATPARVKEAIARIAGLRLVQLYRNYGQVVALSAGMTFARGSWVVMLDGDLQHNPEDIRRLVSEIANGYDLIATYRQHREETRFRLIVTWLGNRINRYLTGVEIRDFGSAYRLFSARLLEMLTDRQGYVQYNAPALYINARSCIELPITQFRRPHGRSKWNLIAFILYNFDFLVHSTRVVQVLLGVGLFGALVGVTLYILSQTGLAEPARAISAPISIAFTSFLTIMLTVIWRELMQTQRYARGIPPFLLSEIWHDVGDGMAGLEAEPCLRSGRSIQHSLNLS
jgi:glycosyltransferase involved in cell wall biosynthesis